LGVRKLKQSARMRNIIEIVKQYEARKLTVDQTSKLILKEISKITWEDQT